jgi:membrane protease YdiL (CAAX protease family)
MINSQMVEIPPPIQPLLEKRVWGVWPTIGYSAVIITGFFFAQFIAILVSLFVIINTQDISFSPGNITEFTKVITDALDNYMGLIQSISTIFSGIVGVLLIWVFVRARRRAGFGEYLGLHKISGRAVWLSIGVVIAVIGLMTLIQTLSGLSTGDGITSDIYTTSAYPPLFAAAVVIFAPLFEEALFRGFLFEGLRQSRLGGWGAIAITSICWAALHIQYNIFGIAYIFILGIAIGLIRWKTKNIWSGVIMHALVNLIATLSVALAISQ